MTSHRVERVATAARIMLDRQLDQMTADQIAAWSAAWDDLSVEWRNAIAEIEAMRVGGKWPTRRQVLQAARVRDALAQTRERIDALCEAAGINVAGILPEIAASGASVELDMIRSQLPAGIDDVWPAPAVQIDAIVERSTRQVTQLASVLGAEAERDLKALLVRGVAAGASPRRAAALMLQRVEGRTILSRDRADTIARTEILDAHRAAARVTRLANADVLSGWMWLCHPSERTCRACLSLHGSMHDVGERGPDGHQRCRCTAQPVARTWAELGFAGIDDEREPIESGEQWLARQSTAMQDKVLGQRGADLWRRGEWPSSEWAVKRSNDGWRDAWYTAPAPR